MQKLTLEKIAEMSDTEVYALSMPRPNNPEARGFMFSSDGKNFESQEGMAECMCALIKRLSKIER